MAGKDYRYGLLAFPCCLPWRPCFPFSRLSLSDSGSTRRGLRPWALKKKKKRCESERLEKPLHFTAGVKTNDMNFLSSVINLLAGSCSNALCVVDD